MKYIYSVTDFLHAPVGKQQDYLLKQQVIPIYRAYIEFIKSLKGFSVEAGYLEKRK